jgi:hypothetical protein
MILEEIAPLMFYLNPAKREDRRKLCRAEFAKHRLNVERFPITPEARVKCTRGHLTEERYVSGLSKRLLIREAKRRRAPAVVMFEDDVIFHDYFRTRLEEMELPDDWQVFYLGCAHQEPGTPVSQGLVQAVRAVDSHAVVIRAAAYDRVLAAWKPGAKHAPACSVVCTAQALAGLNAEIPCYAALPNLVWQRAVK